MNNTKSELDILNILWAAGKPLTRSGILEMAPATKSWSDTSINQMLKKMLDKGSIKEAGFARAGKTYGHLYAPTITIEEYYAEQIRAGASLDIAKLLEILQNKSRAQNVETFTEGKSVGEA